MTLSTPEWARTIALYASGLTSEQVGHELGISGEAVWYRLKRRGVPLRRSGGWNKLDMGALLVTEVVYKFTGSLRAAAEGLGISHETVRYRLKRLADIQAKKET